MDISSSWFSGFFDADGTISFSLKNHRPQLSVGVTNKRIQDVQWFKDVFKGNIYYDSSKNGYYQWSIQSRDDIILYLKYFQINCQSRKS